LSALCWLLFRLTFAIIQLDVSGFQLLRACLGRLG